MQRDGCVQIVLEDTRKISVPDTMFTLSTVTEVVHVQDYIPSVIEPSFGISRVLYSLLEHCFWQRPDDAQRCVLSFPPLMAPIKCLVAPIMAQGMFTAHVEEIAAALKKRDLSVQVDLSSVSLGKKYARNDEIGIPFSITVDHRTLKDDTVTIRERDSTKQIRVAVSDVPNLVRGMVYDADSALDRSWDAVSLRYEAVSETLADLQL